VLRDGIAIEAVLADLDRAGARVKLVILDASRPNPFERRFRGLSFGLASLTPSQSTLIIYSAAPGNVTAESDGENSLFLGEFLKELRSRRSTAERVFMSAARGVSRASDGNQVPWVSSSLTEDFYFRQSLFPKPLREVWEATATANPADNAEQPDDKTGCRRVAWPSTKQAAGDARASLTAGACAELAPSAVAKLDSAPPPTSEYRLAGVRATRDLDEAIKRHPDDTEAHFKRGRIYAKHGDYRRAISEFDQVIRLDPKDAEALNDRCWVRAILNQLRAALRDCKKALALQPTFADAFDSLAFAYLKMGKQRRAISLYDAALRGSPEKATSLFGRGKAKLKIGDTRGGAEDINAAQALKPNISKEFASYGVR
jgi:tetratricopeptide (TPR) repeat protein